MSEDRGDFWPLRKFVTLDAGDAGLGIYLETQQTLEDGQPRQFGCFVTEDQGRSLLQALDEALDRKFGETRH